MKIAIIGAYIFFTKETKKKLESLGTVTYHECMPNEENFKEFGKDADAIITWGKPSAQAIQACKNLRYFGYLLTGYDALVGDPELIAVFKKQNIVVSYTPAYSTEAVAEFTLAMTLALAKKVIPAYENLKANHEEDFMPYEGMTIGQSTVGVFGLGNIGTSFARKISHLGAEVLITTPSADKKLLDFRAKFVSPDQLFGESDILVVTAQLNNATRGVIGKKLLKKLKKNAIIVNSARGDIFNLQELYETLVKRSDVKVSIDVIDQKSDIFKKLVALPNVFITPHIAANTMECMQTCSTFAVANLSAFISDTSFDKVII